MISGERLPITSIQQGITNAVNDCLRMNIPVYWAATDFTILVKKAGTNTSEIHTFEKGTFIIPLTGNLSIDILIASIVYNYRYHNPIEQYYPVSYYLLMEPIHLSAYRLNAPQIVYYLGDEIVWDWLVFHYDAMQQAGFLNIDFFLDGENTTRLTTDNYNVFVCLRRGVGQGYSSIIASAFDTQKTSAIRSFVQRGGGYIGVKYGAAAASSGPTMLLGILKTLLKRPLAFTGLSLTNSSFTMGRYSCVMTVKIINETSPITFGLSNNVTTMCEGGPIVTWAGQHTHPVATIEDVSIPFNPVLSSPSSYKTFEQWRQRVIGKPLWLTAEFGKGKVVTYGDDLSVHYPERNDRVFDNSIFYVTADVVHQMNCTMSEHFSIVASIDVIAATVTLPPGNVSYPTIWEKVDRLQHASQDINTIEQQIDILLYEMQEERKWDIRIHMLPTIDLRYGQIRLRDLYYDTFTRFLDGFSKATTILEAVASAINNTKPSKLSSIQEWENQSLSYFDDVQNHCAQILSFDQNFTKELQSFTLRNVEVPQLLKEYDQYDHNIKQCYRDLSRSWLETIQLYRMLWYQYQAATIGDMIRDNRTKNNHPVVIERTYDSLAPPTGVIYVDDDAKPGGNGSLLYPYRSIQDGVEAAEPGSTVFVFSGMYHEHPIISKPLTLTGENKYTTIIDGDGKPRHVVWVSADHVTFSGFTVTNCSKKYCGGIVLYSSYNTITDCIVSHGDTGIGPGSASHDNVITGNIIENNTYCGIGIDSKTYYNNEISSNIIRNNGYCGIFLMDSNTSIHDNTFENDGILLYPPLKSSCHLVVYNNTVNGKPLVFIDTQDHILLSSNVGQLIIASCSNCTIDTVTVTDVNPAVEILSSSNITVENSTFADNMIGVWVCDSSIVKIVRNLFLDNSWSGLWLYRSDHNDIQGNLFQSNDDGVLIFRSKSNRLIRNNFTKNTGGLSFWSSSRSNTASMNNFFANQVQAYDQGVDHWDGNYWDDWIGVQHPLLRFIPYHIPGGFSVDLHPKKAPYTIF
ncbi:MAG TPA: NosD domain-containing protein [Candidatus Thermoplasmatota archaeon]|nr:NosD domain-containing protein [Candidatus Thermoplasmatota archaeon]